jgi:heavy metal sensor kinase
MTVRAQGITAERLSDRLPVTSPGDELGRLATVFNEAFARIEGAFERLRQFTADASHELRTPLSAQRSVGEIGLRDAGTVEELRDVVGSMLEESERLTRLVDGLLVLSRGDARAVRLRKESVRLGDLGRDVAGQLGVLAEEKQQDIEFDAPVPGLVEADPAVLRQAVSNLLDNAIKYAPRGSPIRVVVREDASGSSLAVTDRGPGIRRADQARVFDRFYRVDPARARGGIGLGLAIARWAVEAHGGRIELESEPGRGSTFRIVLPRGSPPPS